MDEHKQQRTDQEMQSEPHDAPSPNSTASAAAKNGRTGGGFSFPRPRAPSPSPASASAALPPRPRSAPTSAALPPRPRSADHRPENRRNGDFQFHFHASGGFSFPRPQAPAADDDFYARSARLFAPSLSTTSKEGPSSTTTMEAWLASRSAATEVKPDSDLDPMGNLSAALAPQPKSGCRGWSPMGAGTGPPPPPPPPPPPVV